MLKIIITIGMLSILTGCGNKNSNTANNKGCIKNDNCAELAGEAARDVSDKLANQAGKFWDGFNNKDK